MSKSWYELAGIPATDFLNPAWKFPKAGKDVDIWRYDPLEVLNAEWLAQLEALLDAKANGMMVFCKRPHLTPVQAHIDLKMSKGYPPRVWAINFLVGGAGSTMTWYKTPAVSEPIKLTTAGTPYLNWPIDGLELLDSCEILGKVVLVRTDIPHSVFTQQQIRWGFSIRPVFNDGAVTSWDETVARLQPILKPRSDHVL